MYRFFDPPRMGLLGETDNILRALFVCVYWISETPKFPRWNGQHFMSTFCVRLLNFWISKMGFLGETDNINFDEHFFATFCVPKCVYPLVRVPHIRFCRDIAAQKFIGWIGTKFWEVGLQEMHPRRRMRFGSKINIFDINIM